MWDWEWRMERGGEIGRRKEDVILGGSAGKEAGRQKQLYGIWGW